MSDIQRYDIEPGGDHGRDCGYMEESPTGEFVKYADHLCALQAENTELKAQLAVCRDTMLNAAKEFEPLATAFKERGDKLQAENERLTAEVGRLTTELAEVKRHRDSLANIYEVNERFHWRLVDLFDKDAGGVSPLHYLEKRIGETLAHLAAYEARAAAAASLTDAQLASIETDVEPME